MDHNTFNRVKNIIETGADRDVWRQLQSDDKTLKKRKAVLEKFLASIKTERPKAKSRKKKIIRQPVFEKGSCLTFKLENGNYGGAVVLEAIKDSEFGFNLIATTRINQTNIPTKKDFENAEVLVIYNSRWNYRPIIYWYFPIRHKQVANLIEIVDTTDVQIDYKIDKSLFGHIADFDIWIIESVNQHLKSNKLKSPFMSKHTIKKLTKRWKLW
jgi:hypothetical protein